MEPESIQSKNYEIRGQRVMLDFDPAVMYQIPTKALKQAFKRNIDRFPADFMFQLTADEWNELVTKCDRLRRPFWRIIRIYCYICRNIHPYMEPETIQSKIYEIRGQRVMLDFDLATLYQVETKRLKEAVRRNIERFEGEEFMFELSDNEYNTLKDSLRSQFASFEMDGRGKYPKYAPFAFTELGVAMLSSVLRSGAAIMINRSIMKAFVAVRNYINTTTAITAELSVIREKLALLERVGKDNADAVTELSEDMGKELDTIYEAIAALSVKLPQARKQPRPIGFRKGEE